MSNDKSKPFDLDAAKRGEPVEYCGHIEWEPCKFLGISGSGDGYFIVERMNKGRFQLSYAVHSNLRMASKKVTVRYRVAIFGYSDGAGRYPAIAANDNEVLALETRRYFVKWIHTDWQEAEVPE